VIVVAFFEDRLYFEGPGFPANAFQPRPRRARPPPVSALASATLFKGPLSLVAFTKKEMKTLGF
jgi:hypothetical protein